MNTTGNPGLDLLADAIAQRVIDRLKAEQEPIFIDAKETARRLGRSVRSVHQLAKDGIIPSVRQGGRVMFRWADVERAIEG